MPTPPSMTTQKGDFMKKFRKAKGSASSGTTQGKLMLPSCRQYSDAESTLSLCRAVNDDDEDNEKASCFKARVREMISHLDQPTAYTKLHMISSSPSHYTKVSAMRKDSLLAFVDDMKHITSAKYALSVGEPKRTPLLRQPELSNFGKNLTAMMFNLSTKEAKHQLYTILQHKKKYSNLFGMPEDSLTAFVCGLLQDFC